MKALLVLLMTVVGVHNYAMAEQADDENRLIIEDIRCEGNTTTSCDFIRGFISSGPGDEINEQIVENSKLRLMAMPNFKSVSTRLEKGRSLGQVILVIQVEEGSPIVTEFHSGLNYKSYSGKRGSVDSNIGGRLSHQNLFGSGRILEFEFENEKHHKLGINSFSSRLQFVDPNLFQSEKYYLILGTQFNYWNNPMEIDNKHIDTFKANVSVGRRFGDFSYLAVLTEFETISGSYVTDTGTKFERFNFTDRTLKRGLIYGWNTEDDPYFPTQGSRFSLEASWEQFLNPEWVDYNRYGIDFGIQRTWSLASDRFLMLRWGTPKKEFNSDLKQDYRWAVNYSGTIKEPWIENSYGRWYLEPQVDLSYLNISGWMVTSGLRSGIRLQTESFGFIDLFAIIENTHATGKR